MINEKDSLYKEFPLDTPQGVHAFLSNRHYVKSAAMRGDYDATVMDIDFEIAMSRTNISPRQHEAMRLVYLFDLTQREAGERMEISQQAVQQTLNAILIRISEQYRKVVIEGGNDS